MNQDIETTEISQEFDDGLAPSDSPAAVAGLLAVSSPISHLRKLARSSTGRKVVTTATLTSRTCKWPIGDPVQTGFHYCGEPPQTGRPYCDTHDQMSYQAPPARRGSKKA